MTIHLRTVRIALALILPGVILFCFSVYSAEVLGHYGYGLYVALPFVVGMGAVLLAAGVEPVTPRYGLAIAIAAPLVGALLLLVTGFEGILCLVMASPLLLVLLLLGGAAAMLVNDIFKRRGTSPKTRVMLVGGLSLSLFAGMTAEPALLPEAPARMVRTSVVVEGPITEVWDSVVAFPPITAPPGGILGLGIAYPVAASIDGEGTGAVRRCTFTTGDFVEPITAWEPPHRLAFDVIENPAPMREWSPFANIEPPHLHGFLVSEKGQFRLESQADGTVLLEGTTWYRQHLWPNGYWGVISDRIIHRIHRRVLEHIKETVELVSPV